MEMGISITFWRAIVFKEQGKGSANSNLLTAIMSQAQAPYLCSLILLEEGETAEHF